MSVPNLKHHRLMADFQLSTLRMCESHLKNFCPKKTSEAHVEKVQSDQIDERKITRTPKNSERKMNNNNYLNIYI